MQAYRRGMVKAASVLGMRPSTFEHVADLAGLATLAAIPTYHLYRHFSDAPAEDTAALDHSVDLAGLGILAAPTALKLLKR